MRVQPLGPGLPIRHGRQVRDRIIDRTGRPAAGTRRQLQHGNLTAAVFVLLVESSNGVRRGWRERIAGMFGRGN